MCGIAAIFAYHSQAPFVDEGELISIRDCMAARGPDGTVLWLNHSKRIGLAHRRLSVIDVSTAGAQPMLLPEKEIAITFNGEIYNYRELRSALEKKGHSFRSTSDTEVLLRLYLEHGESMVEKLRGMFAFAICDGQKRKLFLARDPFGIKPLYWADDGKTFRAASQVKALLAGGKMDNSPEAAGHIGFFLWGHVPEPYTLHRDIRSLPAGNSMAVDADGGKNLCEFCSIPQIFSEAEQHVSTIPQFNASTNERLHSALSDTVRHHLIADVPVGVFLSSGLDSNTIAAFAAQQGGTLRTITLGFEEYKNTANDETSLAEKIARQLGAQHKTIWVSRDDFKTHAQKLFAGMDQPSTDGVNTYFVSLAAARANLKVALSGLGGDELFGGYPSFYQIPRLTRSLGWLGKSNSFGRAVRVISSPILKQFTSPKYAGLFEYGGNYAGAYLLRRGMFMPWELPEILDPEFVRQGWAELQPLLRLEETLDGLRDPWLKVSCLETCWYMRNQLLRDSDWAGMAHSLEIRVPFVDIEFLRAIMPMLARDSHLTKRDMANSLDTKLPDEILSRPKTGFTVPIRQWLMAGSQKSNFNQRWNERGLRGWARTVHRQFVGDADFVRARSRKISLKTLPPNRKEPKFRPSGKNVLVLLSDAFGGFGGIAKFNRDFLNALCANSEIKSVTAIPRIIQEPINSIPQKLNFITAAANHKSKYLFEVVSRLRSFRRQSVELIVCAHIHLLPIAFFVRSLMQSKPSIVLIIHGVDAWKPTSKKLVNRFANKVDAFIAVSELTKNRFISWTGISADKGFILPNCVDLSRFAPGQKNEKLLRRHKLQGRTILLTVGRLVSAERYKGFDEVLEILNELKQEIPNVAYLIVGDGDDRVRLEQKVASLGLQGTVVFAGRISEEEKADHYRLADAYVMPSRGEGFGIVFLEALACGIPVIGSKLDGSREALRNGELGILVDPAKPDEIISAIKKVLRTKKKNVPTGLDYFSYPRFKQRCREWLNSFDNSKN